MMSKSSLSGITAAALIAASCSSAPQSLTSPTAADGGSTTAAADGSTLKATAPGLLSPADGEVLETLTPTFAWTQATGKYAPITPVYELEISSAGGVYRAMVNGTAHEVPDATAEYATDYSWRVRAVQDGAEGPWSSTFTFRSPDRTTFVGSGRVGPPRAIFLNEAVSIIFSIYQAAGWDIGSRSTREQRNAYLEAAVAAVHFGHPRWNPEGPDTSWCIKNGGPGRPQADDVIVLCQSREAWDLVQGIGGPTPHWHPDYIGRLPGEQAVYAPNPASMSILP
jgi:hypothetical protein